MQALNVNSMQVVTQLQGVQRHRKHWLEEVAIWKLQGIKDNENISIC